MSEAEPNARKPQGRPIDAYLAHNSNDKDFVRQIDQHLTSMGVETWFDDRNFPTYGDGTSEMSRALDTCRRLVVFFGQKGTGPIQTLEISAAIRNFQKVIVVLLPDATPEDLALRNPQLAMFSGFYHHRFRALEDEDALVKLWEAITDKIHPSKTKPPEPPPSPEPQLPPSSPWGLTESELDLVYDRLLLEIDDSPLVLVVGSHFVNNQKDHCPSSYELTRALLHRSSELDLSKGLKRDDDPGRFLPSLSSASLFLVTQWSETAVERFISDLVRKNDYNIPELYCRVANLLCMLQQYRTLAPNAPDLIVTTNVDCMIEAALIAQGISFKQVILDRRTHWLRYCIVKSADDTVHFSAKTFRRVDGAAEMVTATNRVVDMETRVDDIREVRKLRGGAHGSNGDHDGARSLSEVFRDFHREWGRLHEGRESDSLLRQALRDNVDDLSTEDVEMPLVLRYNGSENVRQSFSICSDHYFQLIQQPDLIPDSLRRRLRESTNIVINYNPLDIEMRHLYYGLFGGQRDVSRSWVLVRDPDPASSIVGNDPDGGKVAASWNVTGRPIKPSIAGSEVVQVSADTFIRSLIERVS